jgi:protein TonB
MAAVRTVSDNNASIAGLTRWIGSLSLVLVLHMGVGFAVLRNIDAVTAPAAPPAVMMIDLPIDALLPQAESVQSIAAEEIAEVDPAEVVETSAVAADEPVDETPEVDEEDQPEPVVEIPPEEVETVAPTEVGESPVVIAELVEPTETVTAEPVEEPAPKPRKKPQAVKQHASNASNNSAAAAGAGRSDPKALARYISQIRARILRYRQSVPAGTYGRVIVRATITRSGGLSGIGISRSSGNSALDRAALTTVRRVGSVPPIPTEIGRSSIAITIPFSFRER